MSLRVGYQLRILRPEKSIGYVIFELQNACISNIYSLLLIVICNDQFTDSKNDCKRTVIKFTSGNLELTLIPKAKYLTILFLFNQTMTKTILWRSVDQALNDVKYGVEVVD
jgi:hypothetical protein